MGRCALRDLSDIQLAILDGHGINEHLARWSRRFVNPWRLAGPERREGIPEARNRIFRGFRDGSQLTWLLMCDDDCVPVERTEALLKCQDDLAAPHIIAKTGTEAHPRGLTAACMKVHRCVVEAIPEPWFTWPKRGCECQTFAMKAREAGFLLSHVGAMGHRFPVVVIPGHKGPEFKFDCELRGMSNGA